MTTVAFARSPRLTVPDMPGGELHLEAPPEVPRVIPGGLLMKIMPVVMVVAMVGMVGLLLANGGARNPTALLFPMMMVMSMVGMFAGGGGRGSGPKAAELNEDRKDYLRYLGQVRERVRDAAQHQRDRLQWLHPDPETLWSMVRTRRMWERAVTDADFLEVRVGRGHQRLATRLVPPQTAPVDELEPISTVALRRFVRAHSVVTGLPVSISLRGFPAIGLSGDAATRRGLVRAVLAQLAIFHGPDELMVAVVVRGPARVQWEWVKWLPHAQHPERRDAVGPERLMYSSLDELETALGASMSYRSRFVRGGPPTLDQPHLVVVVDGGEVSGQERILLEEGLSGVTLIDVSEAMPTFVSRHGLPVVVEPDGVGVRTSSGSERFATPDVLSIASAQALARMLAPFRVRGTDADADEAEAATGGYLDMLGLSATPGPDPARYDAPPAGVDATTFDVAAAWRTRPSRERLKVPIGVGEHGQLVELDIKEAAQEGMGPHGLCVGATGSGKSEFLRTLVLGLITTHSSSALNLVLVDFKGGATFLGLDDAPHVAATITNLADDLTMVDRMHDALAGEMNRRQELLRSAGNFASVHAYERARENGADLAPLPALFVVVDEFSELLAQKPDFADLFVAIGRLGRSLQMHLLLASQRLEEGKLRGLDSHLSYRIGLRTFSAAESRAVLGASSAYELPSTPGVGYLKFGTSDMVRFTAAYVSAPFRRAGTDLRPPAAITHDRRPRLFVPEPIEPDPAATPLPAPAPAPVPAPSTERERTLLDVVVARLRGQGPPAHEVWLPPLDEPPTLDQLLPPLTITDDRGLTPVGHPDNGTLAAPVGVVDKPFEQRRDLLWADLSGGQGHAVVVGAPRAGKSMLLRTLIMSLALTHTPAEVQFYCLDFGGGTLGVLRGLPHVGSVAGRRDADRVRRTVAEIRGVVRDRERFFAESGIDSMAEFRLRRRAGELADAPHGDVFLVIDGWANFRSEFEALEEQVNAVAAEGLGYGVHVVLGASRWAELRPALRDLIGTRLELRLGDPSESEMSRRTAADVPEGRPGRGVSREGMQMLAALPRIDSTASVDDVARGIADAAERLDRAWSGPRAPVVRMLPERITHAELVTVTEAADGGPSGGGSTGSRSTGSGSTGSRSTGTNGRPGSRIAVGIDEERLAPVYLDFAADPHLLVFADGESGKTTLLRTICTGLMARNSPREAKLLVVDYRRTMLGVVQGEHLAGYAASASVLTTMIDELRGYLTARLPGPDVTQDQLRQRSWWNGPDIYVVVDDYDLVVGSTLNPIAPLLDLLAQAKDVGLHLIVARRSGGASRALYEPIIARLRDLACTGLVMNGTRDEGQLIGSVRPGPMPPGRGTLVDRRHGARLVQLAWQPPL